MLCDKKHSHVQWRDFKMNVLVCDDDQQIVDSIIEELKKKSEETHVALRFYGFSQPSQINLSLPYDIALLDRPDFISVLQQGKAAFLNETAFWVSHHE